MNKDILHFDHTNKRQEIQNKQNSPAADTPLQILSLCIGSVFKLK